MNCCTNLGRHTYVGSCLFRNEVRKPEIVAEVVFHLSSGKELTFSHVNVDSIGPSAMHPGVIGVEFLSGPIEIAHVPFVEWWEVNYR